MARDTRGTVFVGIQGETFLQGFKVPLSDFSLWLMRGASKLKPLAAGLSLSTHLTPGCLRILSGSYTQCIRGCLLSLAPSHKCFFFIRRGWFFYSQDGKVCGAATEGLLEGKRKRNIAGKEFFPQQKLDIFQGKSNAIFSFFWSPYLSFIVT